MLPAGVYLLEYLARIQSGDKANRRETRSQSWAPRNWEESQEWAGTVLEHIEEAGGVMKNYRKIDANPDKKVKS